MLMTTTISSLRIIHPRSLFQFTTTPRHIIPINWSNVRNYSAPRQSLLTTTSPITKFYHSISPSYKYFSIFLLIAATIRHVHPNTLITAGPPVAIGSYYAYRHYHQSYLYKRELLKVYPSTTDKANDTNNQIQIQPYDESDINNVLNGVENEFDSFKSQLLPLLEKKLVDYAILHDNPMGIFMNEDQVSSRLSSDLETFIVLPIRENLLPYNEFTRDQLLNETNTSIRFSKFIKFSLPFFSGRDTTSRKRLATVEVYLLQHEEDPHRYNVSVGITPYGILPGRKTLLIDDFEQGGLTSSRGDKAAADVIDL
ncbi:hypothetical protein CAAN3_25S00716 [[Candida] anglica]